MDINKLEIITGLNQEIWDRYACRSIPTWQWYPFVKMYWEPQDSTEPWEQMRAEARTWPDEGTSFLRACCKYSHKIEALVNHCLKSTADYVIWLDTDVTQIHGITSEELLAVMPEEHQVVSHLGRGDDFYSETGWMAYNMTHPKTREFMLALQDAYLSGKVRDMYMWQDAWVWEEVFKELKIPAKNISELPYQSGEAFGRSPLKKFFVHHRGRLNKDGILSETANE